MASIVEDIAHQYYDEETLSHVERVAKIAETLAMESPELDLTKIKNIALMHDILGYTVFPFYELHTYLTPEEMIALGCLARGNHMSHPQYIKHIIGTGNKYANIIKRAELLDYLSRPQDLPANLLELYQKALASLEENK